MYFCDFERERYVYMYPLVSQTLTVINTCASVSFLKGWVHIFVQVYLKTSLPCLYVHQISLWLL